MEAGSLQSPGARRAQFLRSLPVGWAALILIGLGIVGAGIAIVVDPKDYAASGFAIAVVLAGTILGLAGWDLFVQAHALRHAPYLALPERISVHLPRRLIPILSPVAFVGGILFGHQFWH